MSYNLSGVGLCLRVRLEARRNKLKLVRQATQAAPTSCVGFLQGGDDLGRVGGCGRDVVPTV